MVSSLLDDGGRTRQVLIRGVGARTNETDFEFIGPAVLLDSVSKLGDGRCKIRCEGPIDVRFKLGEVLIAC
jgi:hypothetical protein